MKKFLVSGCSFTHNQPWPDHLVSTNFTIKNLGRSGAGNNYISNSITANIDWKPDFVFVLWSGINRLELRTSTSEVYNKFLYKGSPELLNSTYWISGGINDIEKNWIGAYNQMRDPSWPDIVNLSDWFNLPSYIKQECIDNKIDLSIRGGESNVPAFVEQYHMLQYIQRNQHYYSELTFQHVMNCFNMLEKFNIPYKFSFIYDIFADHNNNFLGQAVKEHYYKFINWNHYIDFTPFEYGLRNDLLSADGFHLTKDGYSQWGTEVSKILQNQSELKNLLK